MSIAVDEDVEMRVVTNAEVALISTLRVCQPLSCSFTSAT